MSMDLILWRHAEAVDAPDTADDLARALTAKGQQQAKRMAAWLNQRLPQSTRVLCSPSVRTVQTADALGRKVRVVDAIGPGASPRELLQAARWPDAREPVLIVGHQPTLGQLLSLLVGHDPAGGWPVRKGGVWWLRSRERDGDDQVVVVAVQNPELL